MHLRGVARVARSIERRVGWECRLPQVLRDAVADRVAGSDPHYVTVAVPLEILAWPASRRQYRWQVAAGAGVSAAVERSVPLALLREEELIRPLCRRTKGERRNVQLLDDRVRPVVASPQ